MRVKRIAALRTVEDFREHIKALGIDISVDEELAHGGDSPLAQPFDYAGKRIGNRWCVLPMEGWDAGADGRPTDLVRRRWSHFGQSGAKLIWGGEACAVRPDGRANPQQLMILDETVGDIAALRAHLVAAHAERYGAANDLYIGLQLTHSGRFARPYDKKKLEPKILYHHPILDAKFGISPESPVMSDAEIEELIGQFVHAATLAQDAGFDFIDLKHCHGYLGHEFLSAYNRPGPYGGSLENRTRFLREIVNGVRSEAPGLNMGVRFSAFDFTPFAPAGDDRHGAPADIGANGYPYAFGGDGTGVGVDLSEPLHFLDVLADLDIQLVNITAGSPYYCPHIQRPALFPPSDAYQPPEDPLVGVARQINVTAELKKARSDFVFVGSGYSYLQEWLPYVAQAVIKQCQADFVGIGRLVLSYPELPADVIAGKLIDRRRLCRTFSDCTTAPRNGLVSGCYPLDDYYQQMPEYEVLTAFKRSN